MGEAAASDADVLSSGSVGSGSLASGALASGSLGSSSADAEHDRKSAAVLTIIRLFRALERVDSGLTPQQYRVLTLVGAGGERSARLAERLAVAKPTLTTTADSLVAAGLLCRETEVGDRRVVRLCLTPAGQVAVDRADAVYSQWFGRLLDLTGNAEHLLPDLDLLDDALDQLRSARRAAKSTPQRVGPSRDEAVESDRAMRPVHPEGTSAMTEEARSERQPPEGGCL